MIRGAYQQQRLPRLCYRATASACTMTQLSSGGLACGSSLSWKSNPLTFQSFAFPTHQYRWMSNDTSSPSSSSPLGSRSAWYQWADEIVSSLPKEKDKDEDGDEDSLLPVLNDKEFDQESTPLPWYSLRFLFVLTDAN
jgi:hypothetical protein